MDKTRPIQTFMFLLLLIFGVGCGRKTITQIQREGNPIGISTIGVERKYCPEVDKRFPELKYLECDTKVIINEDLIYLQSLDKRKGTRYFKLISERMAYLIETDPEIKAVATAEKISEIPNFFPIISIHGEKPSLTIENLKEIFHPNLFMNNISAKIELMQAWDGVAYTMKLDSESFAVNSQKSIIKIQSPLFEIRNLPNLSYTTSEANRIFRLSHLLYSVARRGGGRTTNYPLPCPDLHSHEGQTLCEVIGYSAIETQTNFLETALNQCLTCSEGEKLLLQQLKTELKQRVLNTQPKLGGLVLTQEIDIEEYFHYSHSNPPFLGPIQDELNQERAKYGARPKAPVLIPENPTSLLDFANFQSKKVEYRQTHPWDSYIWDNEKQRKEKIFLFFQKVHTRFFDFEEV